MFLPTERYIPFYQVCLFLYSSIHPVSQLFERQNEKKGGRQREISYLVVHSPVAHSSPGCARLKSRGQNFIQVSSISGMDPTTWAIIHYLPRYSSRKLYWNMGYECHSIPLIYHTTMPASRQILYQQVLNLAYHQNPWEVGM